MPNTKSTTEQLRTPLLAALGAGNLAGQAVVDAVAKAKERVTESSEVARKNLEELPTDVTTLREKLDPTELRKVIDDYTEAALKLYNKLAETGEQAWDKFTAEPRVKSVLDQVEEVLHTAQDRVGEASHEAREKVEEVLGKVAKVTRTGGEKVSEAADEVADKIEEEAPAPAATPAPAKPAAKTSTTTRSTSTTRRTSAAVKKPAGGSASSKTTK